MIDIIVVLVKYSLGKLLVLSRIFFICLLLFL
jgi:hypothetical protein